MQQVDLSRPSNVLKEPIATTPASFYLGVSTPLVEGVDNIAGKTRLENGPSSWGSGCARHSVRGCAWNSPASASPACGAGCSYGAMPKTRMTTRTSSRSVRNRRRRRSWSACARRAGRSRRASPRQRGSWTGPVRGAQVGGLAPPCDPLSAGPRLPGRHAPSGAAGRAQGKGGPDASLIPLTVPEVRRLVLAMGETAEQRSFRLGWSRWRRAHQAVAARCHAARRDSRHAALPLPRASPFLPATAAGLTDGEWHCIASPSVLILRPRMPPALVRNLLPGTIGSSARGARPIRRPCSTKMKSAR